MGLMTDFPSLIESGINDRREGLFRPLRSLLRFLWSHPHLYQFYGKLRYNLDVFDPSYDFVFDGFPRSGNTFGSRLLASTQGGTIRVRSHMHCPPYFLGALETQTPVCLAIRQPEDAVISWFIYKHRLPLEGVLKLYIDFHKVLLPYRSNILVLIFPTITQHFKYVLRLINKRFQLNLTIPENLSELEAEALRFIDKRYDDSQEAFRLRKVSRPHEERDKIKIKVRERIRLPRYHKLMEEARHVYDLFEKEYQREADALPMNPKP
jgi:adenylate kinase family enzyme